MSSDPGAEAILREAKEQEQKYEWLEAANSYEKSLESKPRIISSEAEILEKIGFCYSMASRQTESPKEFEKLSQMSVEAYEKAAQLFQEEDSFGNQGKTAQCSANAAYIRSWLVSSSSEKRETLDECQKLGNKALVAYKEAGDELSYGRMCNDLLLCLFDRLYVASDWREMKQFAEDGINCADNAITVLSKLGDDGELLRAYFISGLQSWYAANISGEEKKMKELRDRSLNHSEKALQLSEEVGNPYYTAMSNWAATFSTLFFTGKVESALEYAKEMLNQGAILNDNYLKGVASYVLAFVMNWMALKEGDPDKQKEEYEKIMKYTEDATRHLRLVSQDLFMAQAYWLYAESYSFLGREVEIGTKERRDMTRKAVEIGHRGLKHASRSGSPDATIATLHALSKALHFYSKMETGEDEKRRSLREALVRREEYNEIVERIIPTDDWVHGVGRNYEGLIEADLAKIETNKEKKLGLLEKAVSDMEEGVSRCGKSVASHPVPTRIVAVANYQDWFGGILNELYSLSKDEELISRASEAYEVAAEKFKEVDLPSRAAECYWKIGKSQDHVGKYREAAGSFEKAVAQYEEAAENIPNFADFYSDYAAYMEAWGEIERAKFAHKREEHAVAKNHYEKTGQLLKSSRTWSYLSPNFVAWSLLEQAESLSRKETSTEARKTFQEAAEVFKEAKRAIEKEIDNIQDVAEREKANELSKASTRRKDYCLARADLEEAKMFDKEGDYLESADKYESAATAFKALLEKTEAESDRREIEPVVYMCQAWQKMKMADRRDSPELYREASELFLKAREHSRRDRTILLASGNNAFCKALEFGTEFEATREKDNFIKAKKLLQSAANYYLKAGFEKASLWTSATEITFDAYNYMETAELEVDPDKKMKMYLLAEKCLERSAQLYEKASHTGKRDSVLRILEKVKEKREFALSLGEVLTAPSDASSTATISAPTPRVEEPVGLQKFEGAFIQANLIALKKEVAVGENVELEIQLANLGKNVAFLLDVQNIIPKEFDLIRKPAKSIVNNGYLEIRGKRIPPLETEEMNITLKATTKGEYIFTPKIQYADEAGESKFCELEQLTITVRELGIRGWLRGPG